MTIAKKRASTESWSPPGLCGVRRSYWAILVWTNRGATLAALEFAWVIDEMPASLLAIVDGRLSWPA